MDFSSRDFTRLYILKRMTADLTAPPCHSVTPTTTTTTQRRSSVRRLGFSDFGETKISEIKEWVVGSNFVWKSWKLQPSSRFLGRSKFENSGGICMPFFGEFGRSPQDLRESDYDSIKSRDDRLNSQKSGMWIFWWSPCWQKSGMYIESPLILYQANTLLIFFVHKS